MSGEADKFADDVPRREVEGCRFVWSRQSSHWVCQACGALAADYTKHARWHAALVKLIADLGGTEVPS